MIFNSNCYGKSFIFFIVSLAPTSTSTSTFIMDRSFAISAALTSRPQDLQKRFRAHFNRSEPVNEFRDDAAPPTDFDGLSKALAHPVKSPTQELMVVDRNIYYPRWPVPPVFVVSGKHVPPKPHLVI